MSGRPVTVDYSGTFEIEWTPDALCSVLGYGPEASLAGKERSVTMPLGAPHMMRIDVHDAFTPEQALKLADEIRDAARDLQSKDPK